VHLKHKINLSLQLWSSNNPDKSPRTFYVVLFRTACMFTKISIFKLKYYCTLLPLICVTIVLQKGPFYGNTNGRVILFLSMWLVVWFPWTLITPWWFDQDKSHRFWRRIWMFDGMVDDIFMLMGAQILLPAIDCEACTLKPKYWSVVCWRHWKNFYITFYIHSTLLSSKPTEVRPFCPFFFKLSALVQLFFNLFLFRWGLWMTTLRLINPRLLFNRPRQAILSPVCSSTSCRILPHHQR